jgi:hypothetical protein
MPKRRQRKGPAVGTVGAGIDLTIASQGIKFSVDETFFNLDRAPKDKYGTVSRLEVKDGIVWAGGVRYFDPSTKTYLPQETEKPDKPIKKRRRKKPSRVVVNWKEADDSGNIGTVEAGSIVNIF